MVTDSPIDISLARQRRADVLRQYKDPVDGMFADLDACWRAVWAEICREKGRTVPFDEWFFATDENGECPFEIAGAWPVGRAG